MLAAVRNGARILSLSLMLSACGGSDQGPPQNNNQDPPPPPQSLDGTLLTLAPVTSAITGISYPLHVYLPPGYTNSTESYPVIYATDGQWIAEGFSRILEQEGKQAVLVAIEQGPNDRRAVDYLLPGAADYFDFLTAELIPLVESQYRVDPTRRTLTGTSYGGVFVVIAMLTDDVVNPAFKHYLSFDPSLYVHQNTTAALEDDRYTASQNLNVTLMLTSALTIGNDAHVTWFQERLQSRNYHDLRLIRRSYDVVHEAIADPSFRDAVRLLY